jgi:hypothetical protein
MVEFGSGRRHDKIERIMANQPIDLVQVANYNHLRYHESICSLTPADVYFGRGQTILIEQEKIKQKTGACSTTKMPPKMTNRMSQILS